MSCGRPEFKLQLVFAKSTLKRELGTAPPWPTIFFKRFARFA